MAESSGSSATTQPGELATILGDSEQDLFDLFMQEYQAVAIDRENYLEINAFYRPMSQGNSYGERFQRMLKGIFGKDRVEFTTQPFQTRGDGLNLQIFIPHLLEAHIKNVTRAQVGLPSPPAVLQTAPGDTTAGVPCSDQPLPLCQNSMPKERDSTSTDKGKGVAA